MRRPEVRAFFNEPTNTFSYVAWDPVSRQAAVIDAVLDYDAASGRTGHHSADKIVAFVQARELTVEWVIDTHVHADHLSAAPYLQFRVGGTSAIGAHIRAVQETFGALFNAGPAFARDTLFMPDYGTARCDFPGGDAATLYRSIQKIFALPDATRIFLCHDYKAPGRDEFVHETTVAAERAGNIHVREGIGEAEFVAMRTARDATLRMPQLILPAVQVNMRAGQLPPAEDNGVRYLKIPLDQL